MAFESVSVSKLKWAISISNVNSKAIMNVNNDIEGNRFWDTWNSTSNQRVKEAIEKLIEQQKIIETTLENFKTIADKIDEYKKLENKNKLYKSNINILKPFMYRINGELNQDVSNKIKSYENVISQNNSKMNQIKTTINSLI